MHVSPAPSLAARLKQETRVLHGLAERSGMMSDLLHGRITRAAYVTLLRDLHALYEALEAGLDHWHGDRRLGALWQPALRRLPALAADLDQLHGRDWPLALAVTPAAGAYVERLRRLTCDAPERLAAHAYVRYLGDLHGGQMLAAIVRRSLHLDDDAGTAFYRFGDETQVLRQRAEFRAALDALLLSPAEADALVAEACDAFERHGALFDRPAIVAST